MKGIWGVQTILTGLFPESDIHYPVVVATGGPLCAGPVDYLDP
jgi:hypothetical protein